MTERPWFYAGRNGSSGPVPTGQLVEWLRAGTLPAGTLVWTEGWDQWYPASDVPELAAAAWPAGVGSRSAPRATARRVVPRAAPVRESRPHSPAVALVAGVLVPGAGQAYNGQPARALLVLLSGLLLIPWAWGAWNAWSVARTLEAEGGRRGPGGPAWLMVQAWTAANLALFTLLGLTVAGWLR